MEVIIPKQRNTCKHQKLNPSWFVPPIEHKSRYDAIEKGKANAEQFYWYPTKWLKSLHKKRHSLIRSERREAVARFIQVLLHYTHLSNLQVGVPNNGCFRPISLLKLSKQAGIGFRRAIRVQKQLIDAGYITVKRRKKFRNGKYIGLVSIRTLSEKLFFDLGVQYENFKKQCGKATYRLNKKIKAAEQQMNERVFKNIKEKGSAWTRLILKHLKQN